MAPSSAITSSIVSSPERAEVNTRAEVGQAGLGQHVYECMAPDGLGLTSKHRSSCTILAQH